MFGILLHRAALSAKGRPQHRRSVLCLLTGDKSGFLLFPYISGDYLGAANLQSLKGGSNISLPKGGKVTGLHIYTVHKVTCKVGPANAKLSPQKGGNVTAFRFKVKHDVIAIPQLKQLSPLHRPAPPNSTLLPTGRCVTQTGRPLQPATGRMWFITAGMGPPAWSQCDGAQGQSGGAQERLI